jgi:ribosomal protein S18 acetylase RimI-like enzyme
MPNIAIQPLDASTRAWVAQTIVEQWGANVVVGHGVVYRPAELPGFVAMLGHERVGLLTYHIDGAACEIITLDSFREGQGVGTALIEAVKQAAQDAGCRRLWLITTNDNFHALRFYQKRGFMLVAVHRNAVNEARRLKPSIPLVGNDGIPILDEIELEILF